MKFLLVAINAKYIHANPAVYNLKEYAQAYIEKLNAGYPDNSLDYIRDQEIVIKEFTINNQIDQILEEIYLEKPDVIGFSCYIWNISYVDSLIPELCKLLPDSHIWVGGPEVSYRSHEYIEKMNYNIQGVIIGEGEETFAQLVVAYSKTKSNKANDSIDISSFYTKALPNINGLVYIVSNTFPTVERVLQTANIPIIESTAPREPIDLNNIPFTYNNIEEFENRIIYYESSRGCPFSCSYCLSSIDKKIRFRDIDLVKKELQSLIDKKVPQVKFIDRTFNCNPDRATQIWSFIHELDNGITNFHFEIAGDLLTKSQIELISKFRPGLVQFEIGVQSTNPDTLREIRRSCDMKKLTYNVELIRNGNNVHQHLDLIAGLPYENLESFKQSFNDVYNMKPDQLQLGFLKVLSGSYMKEMSQKYGIVYRSYPPYEVLSTSFLSHDQVLLLKKIEAVVEIYYNSYQFHNSINKLLTYFDSPFSLYEALGNFYSERFDTKAKHSRISRYMLLLEFYKSINKSRDKFDSSGDIKKSDSDKDIKEFCQLLTLDLYLRENVKSRPSFTEDISIYHKNITILRQKYNLSNKEHIEVFIKDNSEIYVHFDYDNRNPLTYNATTKELRL